MTNPSTRQNPCHPFTHRSWWRGSLQPCLLHFTPSNAEGRLKSFESIPHHLGNVITSSLCAGKCFLGFGAHVAKPGVYVFDKIKFGLGWWGGAMVLLLAMALTWSGHISDLALHINLGNLLLNPPFYSSAWISYIQLGWGPFQLPFSLDGAK
jgi:hypothetical protein